MSKKPVRVAVTGAAGQIGYALLFRIASGEMLGKDQPVILQLLEIPDEKAQKALKGVMMELEDCAFPLLAGMEAHSDPNDRLQGRRLRAAGRRPAARPRHGAQGPARGQRADLHRAGQGARTPSASRNVQGAGGRQPGQHQRLHRDEERARPAAQELHRDAAPGPQPRAVARSPPRPASRWRRSRSWPSGATTRRRCTPTTASRPSTARAVKDMINDEDWNKRRVPAHRRQARRGDHRGARPVVGGVGGQRRDRPHARLGARHATASGSRWASPPTASTASRRT